MGWKPGNGESWSEEEEKRPEPKLKVKRLCGAGGLALLNLPIIQLMKWIREHLK